MTLILPDGSRAPDAFTGAAINSAAADTPLGNVTRLVPGKYRIAGTSDRIQSNRHLIGSGTDISVLRVGTSLLDFVLSFVPASGESTQVRRVVQGFSIQGTQSTGIRSHGLSYGLSRGSGGGILANINIENLEGIGLETGNLANELHIFKVRVRMCGSRKDNWPGVRIIDPDMRRFTLCDFLAYRGVGVKVEGSTGQNLFFESCRWHHLLSAYGDPNESLAALEINSPVRLVGVSNCMFSAKAVPTPDIYLDGGAVGVSITSNVFKALGGAPCIVIDRADTVYIDGNRFEPQGEPHVIVRTSRGARNVVIGENNVVIGQGRGINVREE